ncbi:hypothetical protein CYMTET_39053 [Cymbomonas tetramitiformis]|uniref:Uncharacterized protein n=1 Tax=Cymbomonas tetramitiformis TaxID=36881 RepID=A0AAE0CAU6_9CHLO|nr:hypothetical protein CYMTET_39053 [Cymbomonas tetramitiformis]
MPRTTSFHRSGAWSPIGGVRESGRRRKYGGLGQLVVTFHQIAEGVLVAQSEVFRIRILLKGADVDLTIVQRLGDAKWPFVVVVLLKEISIFWSSNIVRLLLFSSRDIPVHSVLQA